MQFAHQTDSGICCFGSAGSCSVSRGNWSRKILSAGAVTLTVNYGTRDRIFWFFRESFKLSLLFFCLDGWQPSPFPARITACTITICLSRVVAQLCPSYIIVFGSVDAPHSATSPESSPVQSDPVSKGETYRRCYMCRAPTEERDSLVPSHQWVGGYRPVVRGLRLVYIKYIYINFFPMQKRAASAECH